ncbi:hypothetical protein HYS48_02455 [Candidatus Woesearchaeota archaeon]|nr:hypothetical protein [Candidatus Woesearchaeota archaeon]
MPLLSFLKRKKREEGSGAEESSEMELDKPPKPPEFLIEGGTEFPSPEDYGKQKEEGKPRHVDDLGTPPEQELEFPSLEEPEAQAKAILEKPEMQEEKSAEVPEELPELEEPEAEFPSVPVPLEHEEYQAEVEPIEKPAKREKYKPMGESILIEPGPLFVSMDGYKLILQNIDRIVGDLQTAEENTNSLNIDRAKEDAVYGKFHTALEQLERKLSYIDRTLFEEGGA